MRESLLEAVGVESKCTRRHALKVFTACAGGVALGGASRALADPPWGETAPAVLLTAEGRPLSQGVRKTYGGGAAAGISDAHAGTRRDAAMDKLGGA